MDGITEIKEAIAACEKAQATAEQTHKKLKSAQGLAIWDLLGGGSLAGVLKHNFINKSDAMQEKLKGDLENLKAELVDINISMDDYNFQDRASKVFDVMFDNFFSDAKSMNIIDGNVLLVEKLIDNLKELRERLDKELQEAQAGQDGSQSGSQDGPSVEEKE